MLNYDWLDWGEHCNVVSDRADCENSNYAFLFGKFP